MLEIDYTKYTTVEEASEELEKRQNSLHHLVKLQDTTREDKKLQAKGFTETLKELKERIDSEVAAIDGLNAHRKTLGWAGKI